MANLEFTEYVRAPAIYGGQTGLLRGQANPTQQVAIGAASAVSAAFGGTTNLIEVTAVGADCRIEIGGAAVVAVNSGTFSRRLNAGHIYRFAVEGGQYLAVIAIEGGADVDEETAPAGMATAARQDTGNNALAAIQATAGATNGAAVITDANGTIQQYLRGLVVKMLALIAQLPTTIGPSTAAASLSVVPSTDQNPIFDHANGTKPSVTTSATIITTGAGHTFLRISTDVDIFVNTAGNAAVDDGTSIRIVANQPEVIPVPPSTAIKALSSSGTATVHCTPLKVR